MLHSRLVALPLVFFANALSAFEINTHAFMSQKAYEPSVLSPSHPNSILPIIGLDRWPKTGTFDIQPGLPVLGGARRRRGQPIGDALQPMYFATGGGSDATDVDLPPALPVYSGLRPVVGGTVNFNTDAILMA